MCDRRLVRRELLTWAKKIPVVVGTLNFYSTSLTLLQLQLTSILLPFGINRNFISN